jgi:hypothetical protein
VDALEKVNKGIMARRNIPHGLIIEYHAKPRWEKKHTPRRTPIPVKIVFAGENG